MRLLVCGDRDWSDYDLLSAVLDAYRMVNNLEAVIEGEARGADRMAARWAREHRIPVMAFPADWQQYGLGAGPVRNRQMLIEGEPDHVAAFHDDLKASKGTLNMCRQATRVGVPVKVHTHANPKGRFWPVS